MATLPSEFQDLASELLDDEFAAFRQPLSLSFGGSWDPITETLTGGTTITAQAIPTKLTYTEYQRQDIQVTDTACVFRYSGVKVPVSAKGTFNGLPVQVVDAMYDSADAAVKLIMRAL